MFNFRKWLNHSYRFEANAPASNQLKLNQLTPNRGQSLLEVVMALAIFSLLATAIVTLALGNFIGLSRGGEETIAEALANEGIEAVRSVRERAWNELIYSPAIVSNSGGQWSLAPGASELVYGKYTRTITIDDVCRDTNNDIADCPGLYTDAHSKKASVEVSWSVGAAGTNTVQRAAYLSNWESPEWTQTDWSLGAGQAIWQNPSRYFSDDGKTDVDTVGTVRLGREHGSWLPYGGNTFVDTSEADFNAGSYQGTALLGAGDLASVILGQSASWSEHPDSAVLTSNNIRAVSAVSDTDAWAVGNSGVILHYYNGTNGLRWYNYTASPTTEHLYDIHMLSSSEGWAVGNRGAIIRYSGGVWSAVSSPVTRNLNSVFFLNASTGWAVGARGTVIRYNSGSGNWVTVALSPSITNNLFGVHMTSTAAGGGWIVGANGHMRRWNGSQWQAYSPLATTRDLNAVYVLAVNDVWTVGNQGTLLRFNGSSWAAVSASPPVSNNLFSIDMLSSTEGWAVGASATVLQYIGGSWNSLDLGFPALYGVDFSSAGHGWAVGAGGRIYEYSASAYNNSGTFLSRIFDGGSAATTWNALFWTETLPAGSSITIATRSGNTPLPDVTWSSFSAELTNSSGSVITSPARRYFQYRAILNRGVSSSETPALADLTIIYNSPTAANLNDLSIVPGSGGNNIWAVGNGGVILNYNGAQWLTAASPVADNLFGVFMISATSGWAVGDSGKILSYNGSAWTQEDDTGAESWRSVAMISANDGWAVGAGGRIAHYDGIIWDENITSPVGGMLNRVVTVSSNDVWAVGNTNNGEIIHYDGISWSIHTNLPGNQNANGIFMISSSLGWVGGGSGELSRYDGNAWLLHTDTGSQTWNSTAFSSANDGWAVGSSGAIAYWNGSVWDASISSPTANNLRRVALVSANSGWAVGDTGTIIYFSQGADYLTNGSLISSAFSLTDNSPIQIIEWSGDVSCAPICAIQFQVSAAPDNGGAPGAWTLWYGAGGIDTYFTVARGSLISPALNNNRWVRYRVELSGDGASTPILNEVKINYK